MCKAGNKGRRVTGKVEQRDSEDVTCPRLNTSFCWLSLSPVHAGTSSFSAAVEPSADNHCCGVDLSEFTDKSFFLCRIITGYISFPCLFYFPMSFQLLITSNSHVT